MHNRFMKRAVLGAAAGAAMLIATGVQAVLQDRDLDGDMVVDAFYNTDLNIPWLRDANVHGAMTWANQLTWADNLNFGGYTDWRLPQSDDCDGFNCTGSEMGHLWYVELGNIPHAFANAGNFQNLLGDFYFSGTEYPGFPGQAYMFDISSGDQFSTLRFFSACARQFSCVGFAMAVRPGDVPGIPEPQTYALMLLGLGSLVLASKRRRH